MQDILHILITIVFLMLGTAVLSLGVTRLLIILLPKLGIIDKPDFRRRIHAQTIPRGGGLGFFLTFTAVSLLFSGFSSIGTPADFKQLYLLLLPLLILIPTGILDDRFGLRPRYKFLLQIITASLVWYTGLNINHAFGLKFSPVISYLLTVLWVVTFINAFNMIDGIDGLAAGVGFISSLCMIIVAISNKQYYFCIIMSIFGASLLGFLYYNWNPARLFMGDTGSMFIGYFLAVSGLVLNARVSMVASIGVPLLACGIPVLDILLAVWRRLVGGHDNSPLLAPNNQQSNGNSTLLTNGMRLLARLGTADQSHLHHRLMRYFQNNQKKTVYSIYSLATAMGIIGIVCCYLPTKSFTLALFLVLGTFAYIIHRLASIELWNSTEAIYHNFHSARTGLLLAIVVNPLLDLSVICLAYFIANDFTWLNFNLYLRHILIILTVLFASKAYRVFWNFAVSDDNFRLTCTVLTSFLIAAFINWGINATFGDHSLPFAWNTFRIHSVAATIAATFIPLERTFIFYFRNAQVVRASRSHIIPATQVHTLLIGITHLTRFYRNSLFSNIDKASNEELVGIVSLDKHFVHSYCYGLKVLGTLGQIDKIIPEYHINRVVLTCDVPHEDFNRIQEYCHQNNIQLEKIDSQITQLN